jgi:hypothetical protein
MADNLRGADIQTRHLYLSLRRGDAVRVARALVYEVAFVCLAGHRSKRRADRALAIARDIADRHDAAYVRAVHDSTVGLAAYQRGEWKAALENARIGEKSFREKCTGVSFEFATVQQYIIWALYWLGEFREMSSAVREALSEARARGDLYSEVSLSVGVPSFRGLVADDPRGTRDMISEASARWTARGYHLQHSWRELGLAQCELYAGDGGAAFDRITAQWPAMKKAFYHRIQAVRTEVISLQARSALAAASSGEGTKQLRSHAARYAARLSREKPAWCRAAADLVCAGLRAVEGRDDDALALCEQAEEQFRVADTLACATAARWRRGQLLGGEQGQALMEESVAWMKERCVRDPERMLAFFAPGFPAAPEA